MSAPPVITFHDYAGMVDAMRTIKEYLQLSNPTLDTLCNFGDGQTDKLLGPTGARGFGPKTLDAMLWALAARVDITIDLGRATQMQAHWEKRFAPNVRQSSVRISKILVERAKPLVMRDFGKAGGIKRASVLTPKHAEAIARKGGRARRRKLTKQQRSDSARNAALAGVAKRKARALLAPSIPCGTANSLD